MPENDGAKAHHAAFESIRHVDAEGNGLRLARELTVVLDYSQYRHFLPVIERAMEACRNSGQRVEDHIEDLLTMVDIGSGATCTSTPTHTASRNSGASVWHTYRFKAIFGR